MLINVQLIALITWWGRRPSLDVEGRNLLDKRQQFKEQSELILDYKLHYFELILNTSNSAKLYPRGKVGGFNIQRQMDFVLKLKVFNRQFQAIAWFWNI